LAVDDFGTWWTIQQAAQRAGVPPEEIEAIVTQESAGNPNALSPKGAQGLMQLMPATAQELGVTNPLDPEQNINAGAQYYAQQLKAFGGDRKKALAAYNAGPGNVKKYGGVPPFKETQNYVSKIEGTLGGQPDDLDQFLANFNEEPKPTPAHLDRWTDYLDDVGGFVGGMTAGGPLSKIPGLSALGIVPAAIGGALGRGAGMAIDKFAYGDELPEKPLDEVLDAGLREGAFQAIGGLAGKALTKGAVGWGRRMLKPVESVAKSTNTFRKTGSLVKGKNELVETLFKERVGGLLGPFRQKGFEKADDLIEGLAGQAEQLAKGQKVRFSPDQVMEPLEKKSAEIMAGPNFTPNMDAAPYQRLIDEILSHPKLQPTTLPNGVKVTPKTSAKAISAEELLEMIRKGYRHTKGEWGVPGTEDAAEAWKTLSAGNSELLKQSVPGMRDVLTRQSELIPAREALNRGLSRVSNNNGIGLPDLVALSALMGGGVSGNEQLGGIGGAVGAYGLLRRPLGGGFAAQQLYNAGRMTPALAHLVELLMDRSAQ
jgi:hypothetical protein